MPESQQLTLWSDNALPGQPPLSNRKAEVGVLSEEVPQYCQGCEAVVVRHFPGHMCFHCETVVAEFLADCKTPPKSFSPAGETVQAPTTGSQNITR